MVLRTKTLLAAYFILFLDNFGFAVIFPIFPILLLNPQFHILSPNTQEATRNIYLGLLLAAFPLSQFFGASFFGDIADRFGRKKALIWTISGCILGYFLTALGIIAKSYAFIIFGRLITGFFAGNLAICMAIITDMNLEKKQRGKSLSYVATCLGSSWILAILAGSFFINPHKLQHIHPSLPFWIIGALTFLSLLVLMTLYHETVLVVQHQRVNILKGIHNIIHVLEHKKLRVLYLTLFFWFFGFFISLQWVTPLSIEKFHASTTSIMWFLVILGIFWTSASSFLNPWLINYASLWKITLWTLFFIALLYFFGAVTGFFLYFAAAYVLSGTFASLTWSNSMSLISLTASSEEQGKSLGIAQSVISFAQFLGPLFGGMIAGFSLETLFFMCSFLVFIGFLLLLTYAVKRKNKLIKNN